MMESAQAPTGKLAGRGEKRGRRERGASRARRSHTPAGGRVVAGGLGLFLPQARRV
jgi:hypothetical protein